MKTKNYSTSIIKFYLLVLFFSVNIFAQGYYDGTDGLTGQALKQKLNSIINGQTKLTYAQVWTGLESADEDPLNSNNVILLYTGRSQEKVYRDRGSSFDYSIYNNGTGMYNDSWNREHVWPNSHGFSSESDTAYTDLHHLRPTDRTVNSSRGNKDFDIGGSAHLEAPDTYTDADSWEPRDEVKGDVARMIFYLDVRYDLNSFVDLQIVDYTGTPSGTPLLGKLSTLLSWHVADPVDAWEESRNGKIYSIQKNRNPFIDHPEFVQAIYLTSALPEPSNHVLDFVAVGSSSSVMNLSWAENSGAQSADGYLIKASDVSFDVITSPTDGSPVSTDLNLDDGAGAANVLSGSNSYSWSGLTPNTLYYFKIFPYTNSGISIDFKTDGTVPAASDTTFESTIANVPNIFFSEYIEGGSNRKALEIYNESDESVDLANIKIAQSANGGGWEYYHTFPVGAEIKSKSVYVIVTNDDYSGFFDSHSANEILAYPSVVHFNGNDARALVYTEGNESVIIDVIGRPNEDPGDNGWQVAGVTNATQDHTIVRKSSVTTGTENWTSSAGTTAENSEWIVYDQDTFEYLGDHTTSGNPSDLPPSVSKVTRNIYVPYENEDVIISATVTDDLGISNVSLLYEVNKLSTNSIMGFVGNDIYSVTISSSNYNNGDLLEYFVVASDNNSKSQKDTSNTSSFIVGESDIRDIRLIGPDGIPSLVGIGMRISGVATVPTGTFHPTRLEAFIQDSTAGISIFNSSLTDTIITGNRYTVEGVMNSYNGLMQIEPPTTGDILDLGPVDEVTPTEVTIPDLLADAEYYEGMLIKIVGVSLSANTPWECSGSGATLTFTNDGNEITVRVDADTDICGADEPSWPVDIVGVFGQYDSSSPYTEGYQVLPRSLDDFMIHVGVADEESIPLTYSLQQNYPNPFNPTTKIKFSLPEAGFVDLRVYDVLGQEVAKLLNEEMTVGYHEIEFGKSNLSSGVYIYRISIGDKFTAIKKMLMVK